MQAASIVWQRKTLWLPVLILLVIMTVALRIEGRRVWCACGQLNAISLNVNSQHNSQHLLDAYSFSHFLHGMIFFGALKLIAPRSPIALRLFIATFVEGAWEVLENSPLIIDRYRATTMALGYEGDSIFNSVADAACCVLGFYVAPKVGWRWGIAIFVALELFCLWWIRDNLTLNVIMLVYPINAIRRWQTGA